MIRLKTPIPNNLLPPRLSPRARVCAETPKCNPQSAGGELSLAGPTDSFSNFFIFLSPAFISLHQNVPEIPNERDGNPDQSHHKPESETGVPPKQQSTLTSSITCIPIFSPDVSNVSFCLIPARRLTSLFFKKRRLGPQHYHPKFGCVSFSTIFAMGVPQHCRLNQLDTLSYAVPFLGSLHFLAEPGGQTSVSGKIRGCRTKDGAPNQEVTPKQLKTRSIIEKRGDNTQVTAPRL